MHSLLQDCLNLSFKVGKNWKRKIYKKYKFSGHDP